MHTVLQIIATAVYISLCVFPACYSQSHIRCYCKYMVCAFYTFLCKCSVYIKYSNCLTLLLSEYCHTLLSPVMTPCQYHFTYFHYREHEFQCSDSVPISNCNCHNYYLRTLYINVSQNCVLMCLNIIY